MKIKVVKNNCCSNTNNNNDDGDEDDADDGEPDKKRWAERWNPKESENQNNDHKKETILKKKIWKTTASHRENIYTCAYMN